ncbi:NAD(P)/FAD-dependent oxidoreductase [Acuticoccus mangrovi]|uniref:FAD-binding oxidoreductase n=1 Tax=Acuticoccus mangrovi TaxID=2796142 RepID=A0A934ISA5_9HYPH|nr:FAD-binding oxidoreductase [Acuticoccus mangrovi]MBJ3777292.1 FAD-binding oxidoreductase [Acuticoccus mangrovi]
MSDTIYAQDVAQEPPPLPSHLPERADALVIGGGLTGLSAALHLARADRKVVLVDAGELGDGASGRNGGQLHPGHRQDQIWLTERLGEEIADELWALGEEAVALVHTLRTELDVDCGFRPGLIDAAHTSAAFDDTRHYADHLNERYGVETEILSRGELAAAIGSDRYLGGVRDATGGQLNPLAFATGLAVAAADRGARLFPNTRASDYTAEAGGWRVTLTPADEGPHDIHVGAVLLAGNGYLDGLEPRVERCIMPLVNHIAATEPLTAPLIAGGEAVADSRRVVRYFREDTEGRMIFGGGESYGPPPGDVAAFVRPYLLEVYPQLKDVPIAAAWSGTLGITRTRCPMVRRLEPGLYVAAGYSGQGVGLAAFAGKVIADAIRGDEEKLDVFAHFPVPPFPGGKRFMTPLAHLAMAWFSLRDRIDLSHHYKIRRRGR